MDTAALWLMWLCVPGLAFCVSLQQRKIDRLEQAIEALRNCDDSDRIEARDGYRSNTIRITALVKRVSRLEASPCFRMFRLFSPKENKQ